LVVVISERREEGRDGHTEPPTVSSLLSSCHVSYESAKWCLWSRKDLSLLLLVSLTRWWYSVAMEYSCERLSVFEGERATPFFESLDPFTLVDCTTEIQ
jgi:hypothetical protein